MKIIHSILALGFVLLTACTGVKTISTGLENESFLEFTGNPAIYTGGVNVILDNKISFTATVVKDHTSSIQGTVYAISTGTHILSISHNNNLIVKKQIFVSAQETKKIVLP